MPCSLVFFRAQAHPCRDGAAHSGLGPSASMISLSQTWPQVGVIEAILSFGFPLPG